MPLAQLITGVVVIVWVIAAAVVLIRRRPRREDRSIEAHHQALRSLEAMRGRPIATWADPPSDDEPEEAQVWLIEDDHLPPPLPVVTPLLRDSPRLVPRPVVEPTVRLPREQRPLPPTHLPAPVPVSAGDTVPEVPEVPEVAEVAAVRPAPVPDPVPDPVPAPALATFGDGFGAYDTETVPKNWREPRLRLGPRFGLRPAWGVAAVVGALALVGVVAGSALLDTGGRGRPPRVPEASAATAQTKPTPPPSTTVPVYPVTPGATGVQAQVPSGALVTFTAVGRCWLEATDGTGHVVFQGILEPGATESLRVTDVLSARVGNAQAVQLTVEARPATLPAVGPNPLDIALTTHTVT